MNTSKLLDVMFSPGQRDDKRKLEDDKVIKEHDEWWDDKWGQYADMIDRFREEYREAVIKIIKEFYKHE